MYSYFVLCMSPCHLITTLVSSFNPSTQHCVSTKRREQPRNRGQWVAGRATQGQAYNAVVARWHVFRILLVHLVFAAWDWCWTQLRVWDSQARKIGGVSLMGRKGFSG